MEFTLKEIIEVIIKRILFIIFSTFFGLLILYGYSKFFINPSYQASVKMYVSTNETDVNATSELNALSYAQKVVTTYINFLQTNTFYKQVLADSRLNYTQEQLMNMTSIKAVGDTEIFQIVVTSKNPNDSFKIIQSMQKVAPQLITTIKDNARINVVDPGVLPTKPSSPNVFKNALVGGMFGFVLSILISFLIEILDNKVKNQEDLSKRYDVPILGEIPHFNKSNRRGLFRKKSHNKGDLKNGILDKNSQFMVTEAYKMCRSNLKFLLRFEGCKKIVINSATSQDGKSTTTANIGISIAQTGAKVLLIDCDLRKGKLHRLFNLKMKPGLSDILSGTDEFQSVIYKTAFQNLFVIPIGSIPPNPSELLSSTQMEALINKCNDNFDYIIMDTPPVSVVSDALNLVKLADGILIVIRENITTYQNINNIISKYDLLRANILGFVLNGTLHKKEDYKYKGYY